LAGSLGIVALYPLDLIKTRLMNQRLGVNGRRMYANSMECCRLAIHTEGIRGLYRGLTPQLLCIAPEKAIKLHVDDLLRQVWTSRDAETGKPKIDLKLEVLAGACAGACQLLVTNPMELIKIRLQMQGETARLLRSKGLVPPAPLSFFGVLRDLGFPGVYRGASACLLRDIPFSAIYFPSYAWCKQILAERHEMPEHVTPIDLFLAGTAASFPAALLTAPADVYVLKQSFLNVDHSKLTLLLHVCCSRSFRVKTRLQTLVRPGEVSYAGMRDCLAKIYQQEGVYGFFQPGATAARVLRIAPQFGFSLLAYEYLAAQMTRVSTPAA
jgi:solute carrier family 25 (mitochondrial aspartate/glutamate transporter), member 12/13